jgi:hypothetical protein
LRFSFWGLFGWFSILLPLWIYRVLDVLVLLAIVGLIGAFVAGLRQQGSRPESRAEHLNYVGASQRIVRLLFGWAAVVLGTLVASSFVALTSQGRLTFPALSAFGVLLVAGLAFWIRLATKVAPMTKLRDAGGEAGPDRDRLLPVLALIPLALLLCSLYSLTVLLPRSYDPPPPILVLPDGIPPTDVRYADHLELVGVRLPKGRFEAGEAVPLTLYWRTDAELRDNYPLFVQLLDQDRDTIANVTSHPDGAQPDESVASGAIYPTRTSL